MASRLWVPVASGPLAGYAAGYGSWLAARGYSRWTVAHRLWQLDLLSRWLEREGLGPGELTSERVEEFLAARRAAGCSTWLSVRSTALPLGYLRELGVVPAATAPATVDDPVERLLEGYCRYLFDERALTEHTVVVRYVPTARLFLEGVMGVGGSGLEHLTAAYVSQFLARECRRRSVAGARDYAILLLLSRLGLRAGEVATLTLEDLDWRAGELLVAGKGGRYDRLPLPVDVGEAIVSYLCRRPRIGDRALFLRVVAPAGALRTSAVSGVVRSACRRAGLPPVGSHALRHTAATEMLKQGASLPQIGEVLRHREQKTTAIYAKVDRRALRPLARPWPEGGAA
jgi:integrase/recombinase XerD